VISNKNFYTKHVYEYFPDPTKGVDDEKKLGGLCVEQEGDEMYAIAPKNYYIRTSKCSKLKGKGYSRDRNKHITAKSFIDNIDKNTPVHASNCGFHLKHDELVKDVINKVAISGVHTKMIVLPNQCCAPYIYGIKASNYLVRESAESVKSLETQFFVPV
jgi:hypothetical protein